MMVLDEKAMYCGGVSSTNLINGKQLCSKMWNGGAFVYIRDSTSFALSLLVLLVSELVLVPALS